MPYNQKSGLSIRWLRVRISSASCSAWLATRWQALSLSANRNDLRFGAPSPGEVGRSCQSLPRFAVGPRIRSAPQAVAAKPISSPVALGGQSSPLVVRQSDLLALELLAKYAVSLHQVRHHVLLLSVQPTGERNNHELPCLENHGWQSAVSSVAEAGRTAPIGPQETACLQGTWGAADPWDLTGVWATVSIAFANQRRLGPSSAHLMPNICLAEVPGTA